MAVKKNVEDDVLNEYKKQKTKIKEFFHSKKKW